jgi:hypothetical protein
MAYHSRKFVKTHLWTNGLPAKSPSKIRRRAKGQETGGKLFIFHSPFSDDIKKQPFTDNATKKNRLYSRKACLRRVLENQNYRQLLKNTCPFLLNFTRYCSHSQQKEIFMKNGLLIAAAVIFPLSVYAEGDTPDVLGTPSAQESFNALDTNHDGYISPQEAKADPKLAAQWDMADGNSDGKIEKSEFSAFEAGTAPTYTPEENSDEPSIGAEPTK